MQTCIINKKLSPNYGWVLIMPLENLKCVNCGCNTSKPLFRKFDLDISQCLDCSLIFVNPRLPEKDILNRYDDDYFLKEYLPSFGIVDNNYNLDFFDQRYSTIIDLIEEKRQLSNEKKLLEIGFGAGFFLKSAERAGWDVVGTEASLPCFQFASDELSLNVKFEKAEDINFEANTFDVIVMFDVIEHLFNPLRVLKAANNMLNEGGLLVISTPNYNALSRLFLGINWSIFSPVDHLFYFTEDSLGDLLNRSGFSRNFYIRNNAGSGVYETMNPRNSHFPHSLRARFYTTLVNTFGKRALDVIQRNGRGDVLLSFAYGQKEEAVIQGSLNTSVELNKI